jgi:hypothetical protein
MKCATISSHTFFDPVLNPGRRMDASFGLSLAAIEQGRIDLLRQCFDDLFSRPAQARQWWTRFRQCQSWEEAEQHLLDAYGIKRTTGLPHAFLEGMRALLRRMLTENLHELEAESSKIQRQVQKLKLLLSI